MSLFGLKKTELIDERSTFYVIVTYICPVKALTSKRSKSMKVRHFVIIGVAIGVIALMFIVISNNKGKDEKKKKEQQMDYFAAHTVRNDTFKYEVASHGIVTAIHQVPLASEVQGKMLPGSVPFRPGVSFKKGQVLCKIDNAEYLYTLAARKSSFVNLIASILPDIQLDFPEEKEKWQDYLDKIVLNKPLPEMPMWNSKKEKVFLASRNIITEYFTIKSQEERVTKYTIHAPFNGMFLTTNTQVYANVSPGVQLATIMQTGAFELKAPFQVQDLSYIEEGTEADILHTDGSVIGHGKVDRISDQINANTQSVDVYFTIVSKDGVKIRSGQYVNVNVTTERVPNVIEVPRKAISGNTIYTYTTQDSLLHKTEVEVIRKLNDSYLVRGIQDHDTLIVDRVEDYVDTVKVGIVMQ